MEEIVVAVVHLAVVPFFHIIAYVSSILNVKTAPVNKNSSGTALS